MVRKFFVLGSVLLGSFSLTAVADGPAPAPGYEEVVIQKVKEVRSTGDSVYVIGQNGNGSAFAREGNEASKRAIAEDCLKLALFAKATGATLVIYGQETVSQGGDSVGPGAGTSYCAVR